MPPLCVKPKLRRGSCSRGAALPGPGPEPPALASSPVPRPRACLQSAGPLRLCSRPCGPAQALAVDVPRQCYLLQGPGSCLVIEATLSSVCRVVIKGHNPDDFRAAVVCSYVTSGWKRAVTSQYQYDNLISPFLLSFLLASTSVRSPA